MTIYRVPGGDGWLERLADAFRDAQDGDEVRSCSLPDTQDVRTAAKAASGRRVAYKQESGWAVWQSLPVLRELLAVYLKGVPQSGWLNAVTDCLEGEGLDGYTPSYLGCDFYRAETGVGILVLDGRTGRTWPPQDELFLSANLEGVLAVLPSGAIEPQKEFDLHNGKLVYFLYPDGVT